MKKALYFKQSNQSSSDRAFTLVELFVVLGTLAVLVLVLVPALAGTRGDAWRLQCQNNLKQLEVGMQLFTQDHGDMLPPAAHQGAIGQLSWDSWIYNYISGGRSVTLSQARKGVYALNTNDAAAMGIGLGLPVVACPVDAQLPKINWMHVSGDPAQPLQFAPRTYATVCVGRNWAVDYQVDPQNGKYPLPDLNQANRFGVGIWWHSSTGSPDWDAKGYKISVIKNPAGTLLLCEQASSQDTEGSIWPCFSFGPYSSSGGSYSSLYQIDATAPTDSAHLFSENYSEGQLLYPAHGNRFNYLFHDGHVAPLRIEDTVGTGTLSAPKGMWTVKPAD
jgi:prepilin-type processing-associated H-X9-DG protein